MLQEFLKLPVNGEIGTVRQIQNAAVLSVIDAFDRRVLRDYYVVLTDNAISLHSSLGRLHLLSEFRRLVDKGDVDKQRLDLTISELTIYCEKMRKDLSRMISMVTQIPTASDPIS